jgi:hypothetical protein
MDSQIRIHLKDTSTDRLDELTEAICDLLVARGFGNVDAVRSTVAYGPYEWAADPGSMLLEHLEDSWGFLIPGGAAPTTDN